MTSLGRPGFERQVEGVALIAAPLLFAVSTFFWTRPQGRVEYGVTGGALIVAGTVLWIPAFAALYGRLAPHLPRTATIGWLAAIYGCIGGAAFGLDGVFAEAFQLSHDARTAAWAKFPVVFNLTLFWPGPLFPLSLLVVGALMAWTKTAPRSAACCLVAAGVIFPLSRIPRIAAVAHAADALLFLPLAILGAQHFRRRA